MSYGRNCVRSVKVKSLIKFWNVFKWWSKSCQIIALVQRIPKRYRVTNLHDKIRHESKICIRKITTTRRWGEEELINLDDLLLRMPSLPSSGNHNNVELIIDDQDIGLKLTRGFVFWIWKVKFSNQRVSVLYLRSEEVISSYYIQRRVD